MEKNKRKKIYANLSQLICKNLKIVLVLFLFSASYYNAQWKELNLPVSIKVNSIAIIGETIFAGTEGEGIFKSTDDGENWFSCNSGLQNKIVYSLFVDDVTLYAGTELGVSRSIDNGESWSSCNSGLDGRGVWSFGKLLLGNTKTLYAGAWSGIYSSTDEGDNWITTEISSTLSPVHTIFVKDYKICAATVAEGIFESSIGSSWNNLKVTDENMRTLVPVYSLIISDTAIIVGCDNGGLYFNSDNTFESFNGPIFPLFNGRTIMCFAYREGEYFYGSLGGRIGTSKNGGFWSSKFPVIKNNEVYSLALNDSSLFAGTNRGIYRIYYPVKTSNHKQTAKLAEDFVLLQNYPNPFNSMTKIRFTLSRDDVVSLRIYNVLGEMVSELINQFMTTGNYEFNFNASTLESGVYFYSLTSKNYQETKKLILLK